MPTSEIALSERGVLRPTTMTEAMEFSKLVATSSMVPAAYRGKPADVLLAVQMGAELGLAPMQALQSIAVVNGRPTVYGDAMMALVRSSRRCESIHEYYEGEGDSLVAVCVARRVREPDPIIGRFSVADAKRAKLWGKAGPWSDHPKIMLKHRARGFCLRDGFADLLRGIITREEADDYPVDAVRREPIDVTPAAPVDTAADLDAFAAETVDFDALTLKGYPINAEATANCGSEAFRAFWGRLDKVARDLLRPELPRYQALAAAADEERARGDDDPFGLGDPFGLPPIGEAHEPEPVAEAPAVPFAAAVRALVPVAGDDGEPNWRAWSEAFVTLVEQATPAEARKCRLSDLPYYGKCRTEDGDAARAVLEAVNAKSKEAPPP
jgi:hypothetical protein